MGVFLAGPSGYSRARRRACSRTFLAAPQEPPRTPADLLSLWDEATRLEPLVRLRISEPRWRTGEDDVPFTTTPLSRALGTDPVPLPCGKKDRGSREDSRARGRAVRLPLDRRPRSRAHGCPRPAPHRSHTPLCGWQRAYRSFADVRPACTRDLARPHSWPTSPSIAGARVNGTRSWTLLASAGWVRTSSSRFSCACSQRHRRSPRKRLAGESCRRGPSCEGTY